MVVSALTRMSVRMLVMNVSRFLDHDQMGIVRMFGAQNRFGGRFRGAKVGWAVLMEMKEPQQEKGRQQAEHHSPRQVIAARRAELGRCMRNHVKHSDSQHHPAHKADEKLHPGVGQS